MQVSLKKLTKRTVIDLGTGYKGNADHFYSISENLPLMKQKYIYHNGYFGEKGKNKKNNKVRNYFSENPSVTAREFYDDLAYGVKQHLAESFLLRFHRRSPTQQTKAINRRSRETVRAHRRFSDIL